MFPNLVFGLFPFRSLEEIDIDGSVFDAEFVEQTLGLSAPDTGAQCVKYDISSVCSFIAVDGSTSTRYCKTLGMNSESDG
jgi:hypothetical protein